MHLLGISGSLRRESYNTALLAEAARLFEPAVYTLADINFPLFNEDDEAQTGIPDAVQALDAQIRAADAVVIATPEYNANIPGALKNALDWLSRIRPLAWTGKPVAIMSAAAGVTGGVRAQYSLRHCMTPFNPDILQAPEVMIASAAKAFDENGRLLNDRSTTLLGKQMAALRARATSA